jgi:hypothetical protein
MTVLASLNGPRSWPIRQNRDYSLTVTPKFLSHEIVSGKGIFLRGSVELWTQIILARSFGKNQEILYRKIF